MFRFIRRRKDLCPDDVPLRIFGRTLCSRCKEVKELLAAAKIPFEEEAQEEVTDRYEAATVLAVTTWQDGLLPVIIGRSWNSCILQDKVERLVEG